MRLIDADTFRRYTHEQLEANKTYTADEILEMIDDQPTAYDIEKVEEELEELSISPCSHHRRCPYINNDRISCEACGVLSAMELVRKGGVGDD